MKKIIFFILIGCYCHAYVLAQTTSPLPYCYAGFSFIDGDSVGSDWINSVALGTLNNVSDSECAAPHYIFYNNLTLPDLAKNTSYTLSLNFSVGGGAGYAAWIDYNQDNVFDSTELIAGIVASTGMSLGSSVPVTATIHIPSTALSGNTRMRIRISEDDYYHGAHPGAYELACDSMDSTGYGGETEDYTVNILSPAGIDEINNDIHFVLYPNPANEFLKIDCNIAEPLSYTVYNITGTKVLIGVVSKLKDDIDVSMLNNGLYFIKITNQERLLGYEKFIRQ